YEIVRRIIYNFRNRTHWDNDKRVLRPCAALLRDSGHGPLSHSFAKGFHSDHAQFTQNSILADRMVNTILERVHPGVAREVADVIGKTHPDQLVGSLISSQIDADRMDY